MRKQSLVIRNVAPSADEFNEKADEILIVDVKITKSMFLEYLKTIDLPPAMKAKAKEAFSGIDLDSVIAGGPMQVPIKADGPSSKPLDDETREHIRQSAKANFLPMLMPDIIMSIIHTEQSPAGSA